MEHNLQCMIPPDTIKFLFSYRKNESKLKLFSLLKKKKKKKNTYTQKIQCPTIHVMKFEATLNTKKCTHSHCKLEIFQIPSVLFLSQPEETKQHQNLCKKAFMPKIDNGHSIRFKAIPNWKNTHPNTHIHTKRAKKRVLWNLPDSRQARKWRWNGEDPYLETEIAGLSKKIRRL